MSIKIYLPFNYFYLKKPINLYGQVIITEDNVVVYHIVESTDLDLSGRATDHLYSNLRFLGSILNADFNADQIQHLQLDMRLCFTYVSSQPNISLVYIGIAPDYLKHIKLILYEQQTIRNWFIDCGGGGGEETSNKLDLEYDCKDCDFLELFKLAQRPARVQKPKNGTKKGALLALTLMVVNSPITIFRYIADNVLVNSIIEHTTIYKHFKEWRSTCDTRSRPINISIDRILGLISMIILLSLATEPGDFLIQISHVVIDQLYTLLKVLEGSPIGLKLNIHLNNFFLDCFKYHIELWSTFLDFIEPLVRQVFLAIGVFGCLGFTFQIALLADLISIIGIHSHCFYIYTRVLFNVEKKGLSVLWQVVRGNRYNMLKGMCTLSRRIEAHNYMNRQLYLATIFFSTILFLLPTTLVYYIVFAALKMLTLATLGIFEFFRRKMLSLPIEGYIKWLVKGCYEIESLKIMDVPLEDKAFLMHKQHKIDVAVYKIQT